MGREDDGPKCRYQHWTKKGSQRAVLLPVTGRFPHGSLWDRLNGYGFAPPGLRRGLTVGDGGETVFVIGGGPDPT